jgi:MFS transporter, FHS family, glucose/mannose:H+ symporter
MSACSTGVKCPRPRRLTSRRRRGIALHDMSGLTGSRRLFTLLFAGFFVYGGVFTVYGATVPRVISDFGWSYVITGLVLAAGSVGFFISTFVTGLVIEGSNSKTVYIGGMVICAGAVCLFARWPYPVINLLLSFGVGIGQGILEVVTNYETVRLETSGQSRMMNLLHSGFSAGAIVGPIAVGALMETGGSWQSIFPALAALLVVVAIVSLAVRFPAPETGKHQGTRGGLALLRQPLLILLCVVIIFYVGSELGATNWVSEYFVRELGAPAPTAAFAVSALWLGLLAGRAILWVTWRGGKQEKLLLVLSLACIAGLLGFLAVRRIVPAMALVFGLGLAYSGIYPLGVALAGRVFRSSAAVGMIGTSAGLGSFSFPFLLAGVAQGAGLRAGFLMLTVLPLGIAVVSVLLIRMLRPKPSPVKSR